jgi:hypothetical protein
MKTINKMIAAIVAVLCGALPSFAQTQAANIPPSPAGTGAPLPPGRPAGTDGAQRFGNGSLLLGIGGAVVGILGLVVTGGGDKAIQPQTQTTTTTTTTSP